MSKAGAVFDRQKNMGDCGVFGDLSPNVPGQVRKTLPNHNLSRWLHPVTVGGRIFLDFFQIAAGQKNMIYEKPFKYGPQSTRL